MNSAPTTIYDLHDEIWLQISAHFTDLDRNRDLSNLSLLSKKWQAVAQEWMLKVPRFRLTNIDKYLWEIAHYEELHAQIRTLEIYSYSEGRELRGTNNRPSYKYTPTTKLTSWEFKILSKCCEVIKIHSSDNKHTLEWLTDLYDDCVPALLGILICTVPNLRELKLGNTWLMDMHGSWICHFSV